jgi:hypothetical protein
MVKCPGWECVCLLCVLLRSCDFHNLFVELAGFVCRICFAICWRFSHIYSNKEIHRLAQKRSTQGSCVLTAVLQRNCQKSDGSCVLTAVLQRHCQKIGGSCVLTAVLQRHCQKIGGSWTGGHANWGTDTGGTSGKVRTGGTGGIGGTNGTGGAGGTDGRVGRADVSGGIGGTGGKGAMGGTDGRGWMSRTSGRALGLQRQRGGSGRANGGADGGRWWLWAVAVADFFGLCCQV